VVAVLDEQRLQPHAGMPALALARRLKVDALQLEPALAALIAVRWLAMLPDDSQTRTFDDIEPRYVLLCDPDTTPLAPLLQQLLLDKTASTQALWHEGQWDVLSLRQVLPQQEATSAAPVQTVTPQRKA
jgi:membrane protein